MRGISVAAVLVLLTVPGLAPVAAADWEAVHRFPSSAERNIIDFAFDEKGALHTLSWHRENFLVYDTNASGAWTPTFVREREGIASVALGRIGGQYGALYSIPITVGNQHAKDAGNTWFAVPGVNGTATARVAGPAVQWNVWRTLPSGLMTLRLDGRYWNFTLYDNDDSPSTWATVPRLERYATGLTILPDGRGFGVTYNRTGGYAILADPKPVANATFRAIERGEARDPRVTSTLLDRFWDYRAATVAVAPNGTAFAWFARGGHNCDTFWGMPDGPFRRVAIDPCPLDDEAPWNFVFLGPKPLAILSNRLMVVGEQPAPLDCVSGFRTPRIDARGETFLVGGGNAIYRDRGSPTLNFTLWPSAGFTGFAVRFEAVVEGNDTRPGLDLRWDFGDEGAGVTGWQVNRTYYKPGNYTIRAVAKWDGCGMSPIERSATITIEGPAMDAPKAKPVSLAPEPDFGEDLQDSAASRLPGPGVAAIALVALLAARASRRRP